MLAEALDDGGLYDHAPRWSVGDPVVLVSELPILHLARARIVETGLPGPSPFRVLVTGRRGVSVVLVGEDELRRPRLPEPGERPACGLTGCRRPIAHGSRLCLPHVVLAELRP